MGLWHRLQRVMQAQSNRRVDALEDPEAMLNQLQRELVAALANGRRQLASAKGWLASLARDLESLENQAERAHHTAELALRRGDEDMARQALARRRERLAQAQSLESQHRRAAEVVDQQSTQVKRLQRDLMGLREKRRVLIQRARFAKAGFGVDTPCADLEPVSEVVRRMEEKVSMAEATFAVHMESDDSSPADAVEDYANNAAVEDDLAALREAINTSKEETGHE